MADSSNQVQPLKKVAVIGNFVPRRCGIATFTTDLVEAMSAQAPETVFWTLVMNDVPGGYPYPAQVRFEIDDSKLSDYALAAEFLNMNKVEIACLQHEYGIYGGPSGRYVLQLVSDLAMPVVTTLHTVLKEPSALEKETLCELAELSDRLVVMSEMSRTFLRDIYGVENSKIELIHHGIPDVPFVDPSYYKDDFGVEGRIIILTFGLLSANKGIDTMIKALPKIRERYPKVLYVVLGVTHPNVKKQEGEAYRLKLQQMARTLGVDAHVMFQNRFVDLEELTAWLGAADIYVTPYLNEAQAVSGTLAYAMGSGKPVVSTPYWYATEMLAEDRGRLVPFHDPDALADQVVALLDNDTERDAMRKRAYVFSRGAVWSQVARRYLAVFNEIREERRSRPRRVLLADALHPSAADLPEINLNHLYRLTDHTGIFQHARFTVPNRREGYCTDDNARALLVSTLAEELLPNDARISGLSTIYLSFLQDALDDSTGRFRNFITHEQRRLLVEEGSEDCHGRALWGLGVCIQKTRDEGRRGAAVVLFNQAVAAAEKLTTLRGWAASILGLSAYRNRFPGDSDARRITETLAERLQQAFAANTSADWPWPEETLTYDNARLPQALLLVGESLHQGVMVETALRSLEWLVRVQTIDGHFVPIGNHGWYARDGNRARFDQQPLEAQATIDACIAAFRVTRETTWLAGAMRAFAWFLGENDLNTPLCDFKSGGCRDGLQADGANQNQGAESSLAWYSALEAMYQLRVEPSLRVQIAQDSVG